MSEEIILKGNPICRGIAIGKPFVMAAHDDQYCSINTISIEQVESEVTRYNNALKLTQEGLRQLYNQLQQSHMSESASIIDAQLQFTQDFLFTAEVEKGIRTTGKNAEAVLQTLISQTEQKFQALPSPFFRERFKDLKDVAKRVMDHLRANQKVSLAHLPPDSIVFSRELSPSDTAEANITTTSAFVTQFDNATSHTAILARSRGTPYVSSIDLNQINSEEHLVAIVDGRTGEVILNPTSQTLAKYELLRQQIQSQFHKINTNRSLMAETYDGYFVRISANMEMVNELELLHHHGGHGIGLFRSEYIYLTKETFPSEEEQTAIYRELTEGMYGLPLVIRTFDVGGDKQLPKQRTASTQGPFLGYRAIRFLLREKDIFKDQLRAILRASAFGNVSIMFPMVSTLSELLEAKEMVRESERELSKAGIAYGTVRIGCMIEVPSAAIIADLLAKECDFLSIGTNDLLQYTLAIDRTGQETGLYTPANPSMLRLIQMVINAANHEGIPVNICGEIAADPRYTPLLIGLGNHELSVAPRHIPLVKHAIRQTSIIDACRLAEKALTLTTSTEIQELLNSAYKEMSPNDYIFE